ncbi:MAG: hypothetical protein HRU75_04145 [Planctomycetia bacterium]|nr:MAG: hypothetical protein HRU75_04145 [Planctomycetia bacterium]
MFNVIHITHEAVHKVGGIGTVLEGLITSRPYRDHVGRTLLVAPMFYPENPQRLGEGGVIEYSSLDHLHDGPYADSFLRIQREFHVHIAYGQRVLQDDASGRRARVEVLLIDLRHIHRPRVDELKGRLWEHYGLQSHRYEQVWDFEQYVQLAAAALPAIEALGLATADQPAIALAHEYMGVPTALGLQATHPQRYRTLFHAHEVATVRRIVEEHAGHDVMFYNVLEAARKAGLYIDDVFGPQDDYYKHAIVSTTHDCDGLLAVGHHVVRELQFMGRSFEDADVTLAYNGIAATRIDLAQRQACRAHLRNYCESLLGWRPDYVFTHVTRLVRSKALWRDLQVLLEMDEELGRRGKSATLLLLSTELPRRPLSEVLRMEREWDWPLAHREGWPDLTPGEAAFYRHVQSFNARARNIHCIYINQFGFSPDTCGARVPPEVEFIDIRRGSDVELGLSLYEPFGISPVEPLTFGGICVISTSCGCAGFVKQIGGAGSRNIVLADYIHSHGADSSIKAAINIGESQRTRAEAAAATHVAEEILQRLPNSDDDQQALLDGGFELASRMSWDTVADRFILPAMRRAAVRRRALKLA